MKGNAEQNSGIPNIISMYCPNPNVSFSPIKFCQCTWPETLIIVIPCLTWHFLYRGNDPRSGCISGYYRTCIWNILLKPWCFNFSRKFWFLTWSCFRDSAAHMWSQNAFVIDRNPRQKIHFWVEIMACHTKLSWQIISFINASAIPQKIIRKTIPDRKNKKDAAVLLIKYKWRHAIEPW